MAPPRSRLSLHARYIALFIVLILTAGALATAPTYTPSAATTINRDGAALETLNVGTVTAANTITSTTTHAGALDYTTATGATADLTGHVAAPIAYFPVLTVNTTLNAPGVGGAAVDATGHVAGPLGYFPVLAANTSITGSALDLTGHAAAPLGYYPTLAVNNTLTAGSATFSGTVVTGDPKRAADVLIYCSSGTIYARYASGALLTSGSDASTVFQTVVDTLGNAGGAIDVAHCTYVLQTQVRLGNNETWHGYGATLQGGPTNLIPMLSDSRDNIEFMGFHFLGSAGGNLTTTVASASNSATLTTTPFTLNVASVSGFLASGRIWVVDTNGIVVSVTYTGLDTTNNAFTGCQAPTSTSVVATGGKVYAAEETTWHFLFLARTTNARVAFNTFEGANKEVVSFVQETSARVSKHFIFTNNFVWGFAQNAALGEGAIETDAQDVVISNNVFDGGPFNASTTNAAHLSGEDIVFAGNTINNTQNGPRVVPGAYYTNARNVVIANNIANNTRAIGVDIRQNVRHLVIANNILVSSNLTGTSPQGIALDATDRDVRVIGNIINLVNNTGGQTGVFAAAPGTEVYDNRILNYRPAGGGNGAIYAGADGIVVRSGVIEFSGRGIRSVAGASVNVTGVTFRNISEIMIQPNGGLVYAKRNYGYITEANGTGTVATCTSGCSANVAVTHGMSVTPSVCTITPTSIPTNNVFVAVTARGGTTFTVGTSGDPGAGGFTFDWRCEG